MQHELLIAVLAGLGGMLGWGLADLFAKKTIDTIGDIKSLFWAHIFGSLVFALFFFYQLLFHPGTTHLPQTSFSWLGLVFFGILQGVVYLLVYQGFGKGQVSILNPLFASFSGLVAIFSILFLGEQMTGSVLISLFIIFVGVILINANPEALQARRLGFLKTPGFSEVAVATILAAIWTLSWDKFVALQTPVVSAFLMYLFMTFAIYIYARTRHINLSMNIPSMWKFLLYIGLCEAVAYLAITWGYGSTSKTSIIALISGAFSLPTVIFARAFLNERITRLQMVSVTVIIIGVILLSVV